MQDIYSEIVKALGRKEKLALATLITRVGSAPRAVGAKYLIREDVKPIPQSHHLINPADDI